MSPQLFDHLWHYSEKFTRDEDLRQDLVLLARRESERLGSQCDIRILKHSRPVKRFTSVAMYPKGNQHCVQACQHYRECLNDEIGKEKFKEITFERFIEAGKSLATGTTLMDWLTYLDARYIVKSES